MLLDLEYLVKKYGLKIKGIIHGGAHLMEEREAYTKCNIKDVIWIEGNPKMAQICKDIIINYPDYHLYSFLLSDKNDPNTIFHVTNDTQCSSILTLEKHKEFYPHISEDHIETHQSYRLDYFIDNNNIDILKYNFINLDIQGAELLALKGLGDKIKHIDYIYAEMSLSNLYNGCVLVNELDDYLSQYGFKRVEYQLTDSEWGDALYIKQPTKTQIVMHIMPEEITQYERVANHLQLSSQYLDESDQVCFYSTLNLSPELYDWEKSNIDKSKIIEDFNNINNKYFSWCESTFNIIEDNSILGTTDQKRHIIKNSDSLIGQFIFLDSDIYFHEFTLKYLLNASKNIKEYFYIITPQTVKLWDDTWDVLTHKNFLEEECGFEKKFDPNLVLTQEINDVFLDKTNKYKFGCGWFVLYSRAFLEYVSIPDSFGPYGPEDTFWMFVADILEKSYPQKHIAETQIDTKIFNYISQYILNGLYIAEDYKYRPKKYENILYKIDQKASYREQAERNFIDEVKKFKNKY